LREEGHELTRLVRREPSANEIRWDPARGTLDPEAVSGFDAAIHLSGENISGRFTAAHKREVLESRTLSTRLISEGLAKASRPPAALICASAIGYYGDRGDETLDERSPPGTGFLADVVKAWEESADPARAAGLRVCHVRVGVVLTEEGGALHEMLTPFRLGLGGRVGDGTQVWSWIGYEDVLRVFASVLTDARYVGPVNATAPAPATNAEFTRVLGKVLGRPTVLPLPAAAIKLIFGEMGQALLLDGARILPRMLLERGFSFRHPTLEGALRAALKMPS
jgi:uncharacterized protein (TIGR01777 family)